MVTQVGIVIEMTQRILYQSSHPIFIHSIREQRLRGRRHELLHMEAHDTFTFAILVHRLLKLAHLSLLFLRDIDHIGKLRPDGLQILNFFRAEGCAGCLVAQEDRTDLEPIECDWRQFKRIKQDRCA